jgi:hypothetical protein
MKSLRVEGGAFMLSICKGRKITHHDKLLLWWSEVHQILPFFCPIAETATEDIRLDGDEVSIWQMLMPV